MQLSLSTVERRLVYGCGFPLFRSVDGKTNVQHIIPRTQSGIYVLAHKDGTYYVGLSINAGKRFEQHVVNKRPIGSFAFRKVHKSKLDITESETMAILKDMGVKLTNTEKMQPEEDVEINVANISQKDLTRWMTDDTWNPLTGSLLKAPRPHSDTEDPYRSEFLHKPYAQEVLGFYAEFVKKCIFKAFKTAPDKWNLTCLPTKTYRIGKCISALNVGGQAAVLIGDKKGSITVAFYVKKSVFLRSHSNGMTELRLLAPSVRIVGDGMKALGDDQLELNVPLDEARAILKDKGLVSSIRALVMNKRGMMMSGSSPYKRFHCYALAKDVLSRI